MRSIALMLLTTVAITMSQAQSVVNGNFENWIDYGFYEDPENWSTINELFTNPQVLAVLGDTIILVTKDTDAYQDSFSVRLESRDVNVFIQTITVPGVITNGELNIDPLSLISNPSGFDPSTAVTGGSPINYRVGKLTGYYKYIPAVGDSCAVVVRLIDENGDQVAFGMWGSQSLQSTFAPFEVELTYTSCNAPDTAQIIILSSASFAAPTGGSVLNIDALAWADTATNVIPDAVDDQVTVKQDSSVTFDVLGNDSDCDGWITSINYTQPDHGTLQFNSADSTFTYTPAPGYFGTDGFSYQICDNAGGCSNADVEITIEQNVGIGSVSFHGNVKVYPNPSSGLINFELEGIANASQLIIYDLLGRMIYSQLVNGSKITLRDNQLKPGIYFYHIEDKFGNLLVRNRFSINK